MSALLSVVLSLPAKYTPDTTTTKGGASGWLAVIMLGLIIGLVGVLYFMNDSLKRAHQRFEGTPDAKPVNQTPYEKARARAEKALREEEALERLNKS